VRIHDEEDRLYELIDGVLVEKFMGAFESYFASTLITLINNYLAGKGIGTVLGEGGMMKLFPEQVRIPDVSFITFERLRSARFEEERAPAMSPDLAIEVLSPSNTPQEMDRKLCDYFASGTRLVWYIDPRKREAHVYTAVDEVTTLGNRDMLDGGDVLPGFSLSLAEFFDRPWETNE
jgi:Uma2 family endonuclease